jgi:hypothetical protein
MGQYGMEIQGRKKIGKTHDNIYITIPLYFSMQTLNIIFTNWCGQCTYTPLSLSSFAIAVCPGLACDTSTHPELTSAATARPTPNAWVIVDKITPTGPVASHPATYRPAQRVSVFQVSSASLSSKALSKCWTYLSVSPVIHLQTLNFTRHVLCYCNGTCFWFSCQTLYSCNNACV